MSLQLATLLTVLALLAFVATLSVAAPPMTSLYRAPTLLRSGRALTVHGDHNATEERAPDIAKSLRDAVKQLKKPTPDRLFTKFRVVEVKSDLLASNQFRAWTDAVAKTNKKDPQVTNRLIAATLVARIGDDGLAKMLQAAKEVDGVSSTATNLEKGLLAQWRVKHYTMDDVFKLLKLDQEGDQLLTSPLFNTWATYSDLLHTNSYWSMKSMAQVLRTHYDDDFPVGLIAAGWCADAENARTRSRDLGNILFRKWMERGLHEGKAFEETKLIGTPLHELIKSPKFGMWVDYVERLQIRFGNDRRAVRELREHYDILELAGAFTMDNLKVA